MVFIVVCFHALTQIKAQQPVVTFFLSKRAPSLFLALLFDTNLASELFTLANDDVYIKTVIIICNVSQCHPFVWESSLTVVTVFSHSCWLHLPLVLLGIHNLEPATCLHFEHVTNYLLKLTLRDLAEAFTLLRCCFGQSYFKGWLFQFDCLYLTGFFKPDVNPG